MSEKYTLLGTDGNAFSIIGNTRRILHEAGLDNLKDEYSKKATASKNYDKLLALSLEYVDLANKKHAQKHAIEAHGRVKSALGAIYKGFDKLRRMYPMKDSQLQNGGDIYFNNGSNGTDGDWIENGHLSYLTIYDKKEYPVYSICVNTDGTIEGYLDATNNTKPINLGEMSESEALDLAAILYQNTDGSSNWDNQWLSKMNFKMPISPRSYEALTPKEEYYEDEYSEDSMWGHRTRVVRKVPRKVVKTQRKPKRNAQRPTIAVNIRRMF